MPSRRERALLSWSSGKDSAHALHALRRSGDVEVVGLLTTINASFDRVAMHGVRHELLAAQAHAAGLELREVPLPWPCSNDEYEALMGDVIAAASAEGITVVAFGDLFLADVRSYRERQLAGTGIRPISPIWAKPTDRLAREMLASGLRARVACLDPRKLGRELAGREFDDALLGELPPEVDPCGENGEFHTFAWDGPEFSEPIAVRTGEVVERDGFVFADLLPAE